MMTLNEMIRKHDDCFSNISRISLFSLVKGTRQDITETEGIT